MAEVGSFDKAKKQIKGAIERQKKVGQTFAAMDLPYFTSTDIALTDQFIAELKDQGFVIENTHVDSSWYGQVKW
ncbi:hypothetical protein [Acinetobacter venetianus]|uniref:Uncharacterized protein n=1 Tax=Acinetobacter venetianus TaxID=52133 RepID=A0A150HQB0_9GAMM|nr:hypothetical protein [Acinetobacter venetianus]KXZ68782.1 hypothetical protein AVENLUH13518_02942 [Acinetobacter venetianus]